MPIAMSRNPDRKIPSVRFPAPKRSAFEDNFGNRTRIPTDPDVRLNSEKPLNLPFTKIPNEDLRGNSDELKYTPHGGDFANPGGMTPIMGVKHMTKVDPTVHHHV